MKVQMEVEVLLYPLYNVGIRWGWVVSTMYQLLYAQEMDPIPIILEARWASGLVRVGEDLASACSKLLYQLCYSSHHVILL
jgi:hypothetical protein